MQIRKLKKEDEPAVESLYDLYWSGDFRENLSKRLKVTNQGITYLVAEENNEVVGAVGFRKLPSHMEEFATAVNPAELYILAVKNRGKGVGRMLSEAAVMQIKDFGYNEVLLYSGETHQDSWGFYDHLGFERAGESMSPNGEKGRIWKRSVN